MNGRALGYKMTSVLSDKNVECRYGPTYTWVWPSDASPSRSIYPERNEKLTMFARLGGMPNHLIGSGTGLVFGLLCAVLVGVWRTVTARQQLTHTRNKTCCELSASLLHFGSRITTNGALARIMRSSELAWCRCCLSRMCPMLFSTRGGRYSSLTIGLNRK